MSRPSCPRSVPRVRGSAPTAASCSSNSSPAAERRANADQIIQRLRPQLSGIPGIRIFLQNPPPIRLESTSSEGPVPVRPAQSRQRRTLCQCHHLRGQAAHPAHAAGRDFGPGDQESPAQPDHRPGPGRGPRGERRTDRNHPVFGLWRPPGVDDFFADQPVSGDHGAGPGLSGRPSALDLLYVRSARGILVPLSSLVSSQPRPGAVVGQSSRPDHRGDHLLQSAAGRAAGRRGGRHREARPAACRPPSPPAFRGRPRSTRPRPRGWRCCWSWRSWSSISSWEFSTKATSTR